VLPFVDMSETLDQQYLGDGLAEEILDKLNQFTDLRVIARTSSFWFRGKDVDIADIARKLDVTHVLEGSVRRSGDDLRVTAQLISAQDSSHVWSTTFERKLGDLFAIQDEIAASVASALRSTLEPISTATGGKPDLAAYDLVKQGEYLYYRRAPGDIGRSVELFAAALVIDPGYARAWADLAGAYSMQAWTTDPPSELLRAKQGDAAHRAVELEPELALAQARLGQYYYEHGEIELSRRHLERARELDPGNLLVLSRMANQAADAGDLKTAVASYEQAVLRDPMNGIMRQNLGVFQAADGRYDEALASFSALREINPGSNPKITIEIVRILALQRRHDDAAAEASGLPPGNLRDQAMALLHAAPAHREAADAALARLEVYTPVPPQDTPELTTLDSVQLAEIYAFRGRNDEAFSVLETKRDSFARHPERRLYLWHLRSESRLSPFLKPLHADPRWAALMKDSA